jgi:centromere/kinetochore protein ZW10
MFKVCHAASAYDSYSSTLLVQKSSKVVSLPEILSSLSPASLSERLTILRRDIITHFIEFALTQPLSITRPRSTDVSSASIEHKLELFPAPPNSATFVSRLENLSKILEFFNTNLFDAIPSSQRAAFLKSFSKPLTSGILNHLLIPTLPTSLSGLPKYLELLERAVKFESNDLTRILFGVAPGISFGTEFNPENEIKGWAQGIVSHYQKKRRVDILDQARRMFTDVSSDWHETFQVEWATPVKPSLSANDPTLLESTATSKPSSADHPPLSATNGTSAVGRDVEIEQVDDEGWGFDDDGTRSVCC